MYAAAIGTWNASDEKTLLAAASQASTGIDFTSLQDAARRMEEHASEPRCVFVAHDGNVSGLVTRLRQQASLLTVPVIAVVPHPSEACYQTAFASGADDALVSGDRGGITRRLANLVSCTPRKSDSRINGCALVASGDIGMRRMLGQTLRRAGFDVMYATDARDLANLVRGAQALSLVVATEDFPPQGAHAAVEAARRESNNPQLPALVVPANARGAIDLGSATGFDTNGKLMCFAEDVARRDGTELRASRRLHHAAIAAFRQGGVLQPTYGMSHNISREGLFIRTLDAPKPGSEVWVELRVPETEESVHLRGSVVWRREPGAVGATPFGFGMKLDTDACPARDLAKYVEGYERACAKIVNG